MDVVKDLITRGVQDWGYLAILLLMGLESALIPIPSEVTMPVAGWLAADGKLNFWLVGLVGAVANLLGSWLAYALGATGGRAVVLRWGRYVRLREHDLDRAERWFARYGDRTVFWSRLLPVVRTFISLPAGMGRMPFVRFSVYTFLGCLPWSFGLAWGGYALGRNWERLARNIEYVAYGIAALLLVGIVLIVRRARATRIARARRA